MAICKEYFADVKVSKLLGLGNTFIIIGVNQVLRAVIITATIWIGEDTWSEQLSSVTNGIFYAQFFNTGILILMVNANLQEHTNIPFHSYFKGPYTDYSPQWYADVGQKIV